MLKPVIKTSLIISALATLLAGCQTTITTTVRSNDPLIYKNFDDYTIERQTVENVHFLRYGNDRDNQRIRDTIVDHSANLILIKKTSHGNFYTGDADIGEGLFEYLYRYEDKDDPELYIDLVALHDGDFFLEVGGKSIVTVPTGTLRYVGTNVFGVDGYRREWGEYLSDGTFTMTIDFNAGSGSIDGETPPLVRRGIVELDGSEINGTFGVVTRTGTFSGGNLTVRNTETRNVYDATIKGSFHGTRLRGVTGIYEHQDSDPIFFGAIVGVAVPE